MKSTVKVSVLLLVLVAAFGCASMGMMRGSWGGFAPDTTVLRNFEAGNLDPDMNYYYSGPENAPMAVMGLKKAYALDNKLWKPIATSGQCMELVKCMKAEDLKDNVRDLQGFVMVSPEGKAIGSWLSDIYAKMRLKMGTGNKVFVYTPDQPTAGEYGTD